MNKREEFLEKIKNTIERFNNSEASDINTLDDIYDIMSEYNDWEENEMRRLRNEEQERNSIKIVGKITYVGKLSTRPIKWD